MRYLPLLLVLVSGCAVEMGEAFDVVKSNGFTGIRIGEVSALTCGEDTKFGRNFEAIDAFGREIKGTVCCQWFGPCVVGIKP